MNTISSKPPGTAASAQTLLLPVPTLSSRIGLGGLVGLCLVILLTACPRNAIEGRVVDVKGEALPGVVVTVDGTDFEALTTALGEYKLSYAPADIVLIFTKTGYTPGRLDMGNVEAHVKAVAVQLWPLPPSRGVYLFENFRYTPATPLEPKRFARKDSAPVYGVRRMPETETFNNQPLVICYKMQRSGITCSRMEIHPILPPGQDAKQPATQLLTSSHAIPIEQVPIDEPRRSLVYLKFANPLTPGIYAVEWGALHGYTTTDKRIFTFRVKALPQPEPEGHTEE